MNTETYEMINGHFEPINVTPIGGIKCSICKLIISHHHIEEHLTGHLKPQYQKPKSQTFTKQPAFKLSKNDVESNDSSEADDLWVKTFNPSDLPAKEKQRKNIFNKKSQLADLQVNQFAQNVMANPDSVENISQLEQGESFLGVQTEEEILVARNVSMQRSKASFNKKQIHFYRNQKFSTNKIDKSFFEKKVKKDFENQTDEGYLIENVSQKTPRDSFSRDQEKNISRQRFQINLNRKQAPTALRISTFTNPYSQKLQKQSQKKKKSPSLQDDHFSITTHHYPQHNLQCPCCKGFYCKQCRSSIPPIYRPVPDADGNYHFHPSSNYEEALQFYTQHYYKNKQGLCKGCNKFQISDFEKQNNFMTTPKDKMKDTKLTSMKT